MMGKPLGITRPALRAFIAVLALVGLEVPAAVAQTLTRGPLIQNPAALSTTVTLLWWTNVAGDSTVEYGLTAALGQSMNVGQAATCEVGAAGTCHRVDLTGLSPGTRYYYRLLTNGVQVLATTYFTTLKAAADTSQMFFTVIGDWGQGTSGETDVANLQNAADPPLILTVGDNSYPNGTQSEVDNNALAYYAQPLRRAMFYPALGNHDLNNVGGAGSYANSAWIKTMALPGTAPQPERYYAFDHGDARFIIVDSDSCCDGTQTTWLTNELATTTKKWKFVFLHHTPYSCATGLFALGSAINLRNAWGPLFEQYGVDIVFTGHDHAYERSDYVDDYLVGGSTGSDGLGTIYVMQGGGGATLDGSANISSGQPRDKNGNFCHWIPQDCPSGPGSWCSFSQYSYSAVTITDNDTLRVWTVNRSGTTIDDFTIEKNVCGNGVLNPVDGEQCDQGVANGSATSCCSATCTFVTAGTTCRAAAGLCDLPETCSGSAGACPANTFQPSGTVCRTAAGVCDATETCSGSSAGCPADGKLTSVCRAAVDVCDVAESCDGVANACPADALVGAGTTCRTATGLCDLTETCNGSSTACPADAVATAGTACRGAAGPCDLIETCDGSTTICPADAIASAGTTCRAAAGVCDLAESCTGSSITCPADAKSTAVCRASAGFCDVTEACNGVADNCPTDGFQPTTLTCRASAGACDLAEQCTGSTPACPADAKSTAVCRAAAGACDLAESCDGASDSCPADAKSTAVCRASAGACDVAEQCDGAANTCPTDAFLPSTVTCRASAGACDLAETCSGSSSSCPADAKSTATCRASAGSCDVAESCNGSSNTCPADVVAPSTTTCRPSGGVCDVAENCTGASGVCPANVFVAAGTTCRVSFGACDPAEACTGSSAPCPSDAKSTSQCRVATGPCDAAEFCNGVANTCPADGLHPSGTVCRASTGGCDAPETCTGSATTCPADTGIVDSDSDTVCDSVDLCPTAADPTNADTDGDLRGDVCDACTNVVPVFMTRTKITMTKLGAPTGDDRFKLTGSMVVPTVPPIDPIAKGLRIVVTDATGATVLDAHVPSGAYDALARHGWKVNGTATAWSYSNTSLTSPPVGGIYKVSLKGSATAPGTLKVTIGGTNGNYAFPLGNLPLTAAVVIDAPVATTGQCGEALFPGPLPPSCVATPTGTSVKCK